MGDKFKNVKVKINGNIMEVDLEVLVEGNVNTATYNDEWPERDSIPVDTDPIGDVDTHASDALRYLTTNTSIKKDFRDEYVDGYKEWEKDMENYEKTMRPHLLHPEFDYSFGIDFKEPKCDCGTFAVHGKVPLKSHAHYCELRRDEK